MIRFIPIFLYFLLKKIFLKDFTGTLFHNKIRSYLIRDSSKIHIVEAN